MNNLWLLACFVLLTSVALLMVIYPLRQKIGKSEFILLPIAIIVIIVAYRQWGAWPAWQRYTHQQAMLQQAKTLLADIKSPDELVEKLKASLDDTPQSAHGWYLLGRLYASQANWPFARDAFAKSHQLNLDDEAATINYAQSLWQLNNQQFNNQIRALFQQLLVKNANQPDALAMLAMDAFGHHNYGVAEVYWRKLFLLMPSQSKEARAIQKAIAKAHELKNSQVP